MKRHIASGWLRSLPAAGFIAAITSLQSWRARRTTNRRILRDLFANAGYELIEAESGEDALSALATSRLDLILMDIQLPVMDGYEATRLIRCNPEINTIPIIAVTSYALAGDEAKARAAGCSAYVTKPYSPRALLAKVREYLRSSKGRARACCHGSSAGRVGGRSFDNIIGAGE